MHDSIDLQESLPVDIALKIVSSLQVLDVCSLGCCSRYWRELCGCDCVWEGLCRDRWPGFFEDGNSSDSQKQTLVGFEQGFVSPYPKGWKDLYMIKHNQMLREATKVTNFVERSLANGSIEVGNYLKAIRLLNLYQLRFKDVQMFILKPNLSVLHNLLALHYCIFYLDVPEEQMIEALNRNGIAERRVAVQWWKLGRWSQGFRLRDELHSRNVSLAGLAESSDEILGVLHRGAIHEVIRIQISAARPSKRPWSCQVVNTLQSK
ncbi:uncharacterized protein LOC127249150 [Andrographis paniculata]|uniref:uncharacterized protein LOC127249150 n=1 Tax=Andrographis paniculata TaxID=175694 RepID=UPI0021E90C01|nr:uncharacterized protein LOC127249150 [Andrographis paniculata]